LGKGIRKSSSNYRSSKHSLSSQQSASNAREEQRKIKRIVVMLDMNHKTANHLENALLSVVTGRTLETLPDMYEINSKDLNLHL